MSSISKLIFLILALSIGYIFIYSPMGELNSLTSQKQGYSDSLQMVSNIATKKNELLVKFNKISDDDKKNIDTFLPSSFDFVRLISQIDAIAAGHGISIDKISSKDANPAPGQSVENAQPQNLYSTSVIGFSFTSSYEGFNSFMGDLEKSLRILDINSVKLTSQQDGTYLYNVEFQTYWIKQS